jgi:hypothetical protein
MAKKARVYDGTAWQELASAQTDLTAYSTTAQMNTAITAGVGLVPILTQTIGTAVSSVVVSNAFSATYDAYKIVITGGSASVTDYLQFQLGASTTGYDESLLFKPYASAFVAASNTNQPSFSYAGNIFSGQAIYLNAELVNPFLAKYTTLTSSSGGQVSTAFGMYGGVHKVATSYTGFTLIPTSGTLTGGTIRVYGYKN